MTGRNGRILDNVQEKSDAVSVITFEEAKKLQLEKKYSIGDR